MTSTLSDIEAETLSELVTQVWASYLDDTIVVTTSPVGAEATVAASVTITGAWNGHVVVRFTAPGARDVCSTMLDLPADEVSLDDVADAVGEVVNMVGGNVKAVLPEPSALGLPHVVVGAEQILLPGATIVQDLTFDWHGAPVLVTVWSGPEREATS